MNNSKTNTQSPKELLEELQQLVAEAEAMVGGSSAEQSDETLDSLRTRFSEAQERMTHIYEGAKGRIVAGAKCTDSAIRENPYQSLAIALGVGLLAGILLGRRSK